MNYKWKNGTKYYKLILQPNLFGTIDIICSWGRLGTNRGGYKIISCLNQEELHKTISQIDKRRKARDYYPDSN
jgi:DNA polymerase-3 subunit epsilon